jgi:hypothetical protein
VILAGGRTRREVGTRLVVLLIISLLAFSTRLLPLAISPNPFNNDGITECRIASDIVASRHLEFPYGHSYSGTHSLVTPAFDVLIAFLASFFGVSTFAVGQLLVAGLSVLTVACGYLVASRICGRVDGALMAVLFLSLFGTFVFVTGSVWKESLGVAFLVLLVFAFINRSQRRMLAVEIAILATLPIVHHLVTVIALSALVFLTFWSVSLAIWRKDIKRRHAIDVAVAVASIAYTYSYYSVRSLDALSHLNSVADAVEVLAVFLLLCVIAVVVFSWTRHVKWTFAPVPGALFMLLFVWDYNDPLFPYVPGNPQYILLLGASAAFLISVAWYGFEKVLESRSRYRAVPLCLFMPPLAVIAFSMLSGVDLKSFNILYRTMDFADISLALGIAVAFSSLVPRIRLRKALAVVLVAALILTFPFSYATNVLAGMRHDTQEYEVDAMGWIHSYGNESYIIQTDERLSYDASALYDYQKIAALPGLIEDQILPGPLSYNILEEEWMTLGVNDYPQGHPVLNSSYVSQLLHASDVLYIGGPSGNHALVFCASNIGQSQTPGLGTAG